MNKEIAKKLVRAGADVVVTIATTTVEIVKFLLKKKRE